MVRGLVAYIKNINIYLSYYFNYFINPLNPLTLYKINVVIGDNIE